jgi:hypothetical protein
MPNGGTGGGTSPAWSLETGHYQAMDHNGPIAKNSWMEITHIGPAPWDQVVAVAGFRTPVSATW